MYKQFKRFFVLILSCLVAVVFGCQVNVNKPAQLSEVETLYNQGKFQDAMNVARFNLSKDSKDPASIVTVWKIQVMQGTKSIDYVQQFYGGARDKVADYGMPLIPYLGRAVETDPQNTVRLFCLYALSEFSDTLSSKYIAPVFGPNYTLGDKASNVTLEYLRCEAGMILAGRKYEPAFEGIAALANSPDGDIRAKAAMALGLLGDKRAVPVLEKLSKDDYRQGNVRWVAEMADSALARLNRAP